MMSLNYCLSKGARGDKIAAYEAARIMHFEKYNEAMVQAQLRKAASIGSVEAMRWLGFLGLSGKLISPESTVAKISYYNTYDQAYRWFWEGFKNGDPLSTFVVGTCLQHGIGTPQDVQKSKEIMAGVSSDISIDSLVPVIFLINTLCSATPSSTQSLHTNFIENFLSNQVGAINSSLIGSPGETRKIQ